MADNGTPLILLTRPLRQAKRFAASLPSHADVSIMPMQEIVPTGDFPSLDGIQDLIFTSENAVHIFAERTSRRNVFAWCVGDQTAKTAADIGLRNHAGGGSAEALISDIEAAQVQRPLLHLHGTHTRGQVVERLQALGFKAAGDKIYDQRAVQPTPEIAGLAKDRATLIPLFSPRSASLFADALADTNGQWHPLCMSQAIYDALPFWLREKAQIAEQSSARAMLRLIEDYISP